MIVASILTPLEDLLRNILNALHSVGLPWAWSIVGLTIIVRMLLVPLTVKQILERREDARDDHLKTFWSRA